MYLLDTNVVSELRRARPHGAVLAWMKNVDPGRLHVSAVTFGELQAGIETTRFTDPARAGELETWLEQALGRFAILPMDVRAFRIWARLMHRLSDDFFEDAMIAATAVVHGMTVVTRNVRDFERWDVPLLDPFSTPRS